jgi:hypothetical protein
MGIPALKNSLVITVHCGEAPVTPVDLFCPAFGRYTNNKNPCEPGFSHDNFCQRLFDCNTNIRCVTLVLMWERIHGKTGNRNRGGDTGKGCKT